MCQRIAPDTRSPQGAVAVAAPRKLVNLTPYTLVFLYCGAASGGGLPELSPGDAVAGVRHRRQTLDRLRVAIGGAAITVEVRDAAAEEVVGLAEPAAGVAYICDPLVARLARAAGRTDVLTYAGVQRHFSERGRLAITGLAIG